MITLEIVRDTWGACYTRERLAELYDWPHTPLEVLTRKDGAWANVLAQDRIWTVLHSITHKQQVLFAVFCARQCPFYESVPIAMRAIIAAEGWLNGLYSADHCRRVSDEAFCSSPGTEFANTAARAAGSASKAASCVWSGGASAECAARASRTSSWCAWDIEAKWDTRIAAREAATSAQIITLTDMFQLEGSAT
jgi:hypothetical protein